MTLVVEIRNVSKKFGQVEALKSLSLEVKKGQAVALLGPNGAGKTTALNILQGLRQPTSGSAYLFGHPAGSREAMQLVGVTPQGADFPDQLTPIELLRLTAAHFDAPRDIDEVVELFQLGKTAKRQIRGFSGGERRRVALALCFVGNPELVILDEPTTGLDAQGQKHFQTIANEFVDAGGSIVMTSHYWPEIENIAHSITMIDKGCTVMSGAILDIKAAVGLSRVRFECVQPGKFVRKHFVNDGQEWSMVSDEGDEIVRQLVKAKEPFANLAIEPIGLDEALTIYQGDRTVA